MLYNTPATGGCIGFAEIIAHVKTICLMRCQKRHVIHRCSSFCLFWSPRFSICAKIFNVIYLLCNCKTHSALSLITGAKTGTHSLLIRNRASSVGGTKLFISLMQIQLPVQATGSGCCQCRIQKQ